MTTTKEDETTVVEKNTSSSNNNGSDKSFDSVVVHPLVLLSVVDHYKRVDEVRDERVRVFFSPDAISSCFFSLWFFRCAFVTRIEKRLVARA
jgi:hypothetical protein